MAISSKYHGQNNSCYLVPIIRGHPAAPSPGSGVNDYLNFQIGAHLGTGGATLSVSLMKLGFRGCRALRRYYMQVNGYSVIDKSFILCNNGFAGSSHRRLYLYETLTTFSFYWFSKTYQENHKCVTQIWPFLPLEDFYLPSILMLCIFAYISSFILPKTNWNIFQRVK